jgi:hypothetical protein
MLTHHQTTGQPIRIVRVATQLNRENKTLVWVRSSFAAGKVWPRWFTIISEPAAIDVVDGAEHITAAIVRGPLEGWISVFPTLFGPKSDTLLIATNSVIDALTARGCVSERTLVIEDLYEGYPYLGEPLKVDASNEKIVLSVAHILRMNRVAWSSAGSRDGLDVGTRATYDSWARSCCISGVEPLIALPADSSDACIPRTWLIQQYFRPAVSRRAREIFNCLSKNIACNYVDNIILLNEEKYDEIPESPKITTHIIGRRLSYYDVMQAIKTHVPLGDYVIFANSDIYFNDTLENIWQIGLAERRLFLALLRWEEGTNSAQDHIFGPRSDSQDSWILARDSVDFDITYDDFGFPFGKLGCDNALALIMLRKRFLVSNPAYSIKTIHSHASNVRSYDPKDELYRTHYMHVDPSAIQTCAVITDLTTVGRLPDSVARGWMSRTLGSSFQRQILGLNDVDVKTVCNMLRHTNPDECFAQGESNTWTPAPSGQPLYHFTGGVFVTLEGLISTFKELYVGAHQTWIGGWQESQQSSLRNSIHVPNMIAVGCDAACRDSLSTWCLKYLPRVLAIRGVVNAVGLPVPEFLVPHIPDIGGFLNDCVWSAYKEVGSRGNITVTPMIPDMNYYSENVWAVPSASGEANLVTAEDIKCLRALLPASTTTSTAAAAVAAPVAVFCVDDDEGALLTRKWAEGTAEHILPPGWVIKYVGNKDTPHVRRRALSNASWIFGSGAALEWIWYAPAGATVMEFMLTHEPRGTIIHLAGAAGQKYVLGAVKREPIDHQRQNAMLDVGKAIKKYGFSQSLHAIRTAPVDIPRIILPSGAGLSGVWAHAGNAFREMAALWAERGYVKLEHSEDTGFCWWGGVGEILLYDRPTPRWWASIPSYQMALFGSCPPPGPDLHILRQSTWSFWPRSPHAVENVAARGLNLRNYTDRSTTSLFLGKVENGVQRERRTAFDWSKAVELFSMPIDSTGTPYTFTQDEYLQKLCTSRFGLCLPGSGPKCNREIEYFACGCVPIITPGVDMKGYIVPPIEGVHYLVAKTPEDVQQIIKNTSQKCWAIMSEAGRDWWRSYASAEGLFRITWARIEQCRPFFNVGIPRNFIF